MIITEVVPPVDNSDAASTTNTLVAKEPERMPHFFSKLTYASLAISLIPFVFSLIVVTVSRINSVPTILAYVLATPFHVGALLIVWQHSRQLEMQLPFKATSWRSIAYMVFLAGMWTFSMISCAIGANTFHNMKDCSQTIQTTNGSSQEENCYPAKGARHIGTALVISTLLSALEFIVFSTLAISSYRARPRNENTETSPTESIGMEPISITKVLSP
ncbi:hypothetical protein CPB84DRAFT_1762438 [Gymnopilus junonius]|uniref:Uncharacterized protein n=1 Tax=Gymnopilus junonius TaxID=109634 RepID=A0A9P5TTQ4_GYMJU|nr:hypothetical protein CPB84DRAFT_1762438 [Gymnopilus junonius]